MTLQRESGSVFNQPAEIMVKLAEKITEIIDFAQWCVFAKNGSDLTTWLFGLPGSILGDPL